MRNLRRVREKQGLSQDKLAELSGVPQAAISRIERTERTPHRGTLEKLARALGIENPAVLADENPSVITLTEILAWAPEKRRRYFEDKREAGELEKFSEEIEKAHERSLEHFSEDPFVLYRLEAAFTYGYLKGYVERGEAKEDPTKDR